MEKWSEQELILGIKVITAMCSAGLLTWNAKEELLEELLKEAGWSREELREMNRRREAHNN